MDTVAGERMGAARGGVGPCGEACDDGRGGRCGARENEGGAGEEAHTALEPMVRLHVTPQHCPLLLLGARSRVGEMLWQGSGRGPGSGGGKGTLRWQLRVSVPSDGPQAPEAPRGPRSAADQQADRAVWGGR
jgi:hypothetical protein